MFRRPSLPLTLAADSAGNARLVVVAANLLQQFGASDPVTIYSVGSDHQLRAYGEILPKHRASDQENQWTPGGVYSIHETTNYLLIEYPHPYPRRVAFVTKSNPKHVESIDFDPSDFITENLSHFVTQDSAGMVCDLWPLLTTPVVPDGKGGLTSGVTSLHAACTKPGMTPFLRVDDWSDFRNLEFDGAISPTESSLLSTHDGTLVVRLLGGPAIDLGDGPRKPGVEFQSAATLEAANRGYLVVSMQSDTPHDSDRNENVFFRASTTGRWERLPVFPVAPIGNDRMTYRLFGQWLVTSASASLVATQPVQGSIVPEVLTVIAEQKLAPTFAVAVQPGTGSPSTSLPARRITLWNLADGRRIDLAIPENDSEIVAIFDGGSVLLRIKDTLFLADIKGTKLAGYRFVASDSIIPQVHWAFYSAVE